MRLISFVAGLAAAICLHQASVAATFTGTATGPIGLHYQLPAGGNYLLSFETDVAGWRGFVYEIEKDYHYFDRDGNFIGGNSIEYTYYNDFPNPSYRGSWLIKLPNPYVEWHGYSEVEYGWFDGIVRFGLSSPPNETVNYTFSVERIGAVPEPATWALLIVGFGAAGSALRRRRAHRHRTPAEPSVTAA